MEPDTLFNNFIDSDTVLVDTSGAFEDCYIIFENKQLRITTKWDSCLAFGGKTQTQWGRLKGQYRNYVLITVVKVEDNEMRIDFRKPSINTNVEFEVKRKNRRIWVTNSKKYILDYEEE